MTNQDVINFLNQIRKILLNDKSWLESTIQPINEAFDKAISALEEQDSKTRICDTCKHNPPSKKWTCVDCDMREPADRWEPKDVPDTNVGDMISRQAAIDGVKTLHDVAWKNWHEPTLSANVVIDMLKELPSAQTEIKPISYQDCANAMMMMWIDNVLTDGEYRRIMDKLNDHENRKENR